MVLYTLKCFPDKLTATPLLCDCGIFFQKFEILAKMSIPVVNFTLKHFSNKVMIKSMGLAPQNHNSDVMALSLGDILTV